MQIIFAGTPIATEALQGGTDLIEGFDLPTGKQTVQWQEALRATDAYPLPRGNRKQTLRGTITPAAGASLGAVLRARLVLFTNLPTNGPLVLMTDLTAAVLFAYAVLESFGPSKDVMGVSYGFEVTFQVGPAQDISTTSTTPALLNKAGTAFLLNKNGSPLFNK